MTARARDLVGVIEAAYEPLEDDDAWVRELVASSADHLDLGAGVFGYTFDLARVEPVAPGAVRLWTGRMARSATCTLTDEMNERVIGFVPRGILSVYAEPYACTTTLESVARHCPEMLPVFTRLSRGGGFRDVFCVFASAPGGRGVLLHAPSRDPLRIDERLRARWLRIAVHLSASVRLRGRVVPDVVADAEAVLTPDGRCEHASGIAKTPEAQRALRRAAVDIDRARSRTKPRAMDDALALWTALAAGRWSLVDHFERGGRRYVLARPNAPNWSRPRKLTAQERQVVLGAAAGASNKVLAYDLGLPISTAATILARAMRKLGVRTRDELVGIVRTLRTRSRT